MSIFESTPSPHQAFAFRSPGLPRMEFNPFLSKVLHFDRPMRCFHVAYSQVIYPTPVILVDWAQPGPFEARSRALQFKQRQAENGDGIADWLINSAWALGAHWISHADLLPGTILTARHDQAYTPMIVAIDRIVRPTVASRYAIPFEIHCAAPSRADGNAVPAPSAQRQSRRGSEQRNVFVHPSEYGLFQAGGIAVGFKGRQDEAVGHAMATQGTLGIAREGSSGIDGTLSDAVCRDQVDVLHAHRRERLGRTAIGQPPAGKVHDLPKQWRCDGWLRVGVIEQLRNAQELQRVSGCMRDVGEDGEQSGRSPQGPQRSPHGVHPVSTLARQYQVVGRQRGNQGWQDRGRLNYSNTWDTVLG